MQNVKVLRPFNKTPQGNIAEVGEVIEVEPVRAQELERLGLAEPVTAEVRSQNATDNLSTASKAAPVPENKQAPVPENKMQPDTSVTVTRRPAGSTRAPKAVKR